MYQWNPNTCRWESTYMSPQNIGQYLYWNPWRGCTPITEACKNCYVKIGFVDKYHPFNYTNVEDGTVVEVCLQSDFFIKDADHLRDRAWKEIKEHGNLIFMIITKRADRIKDCLPEDWGDGYDNVILCCTAETQQRIDERLPLFLEVPCKHRWVAVCPLLEEVDLSKYLATGKIEGAEANGEKGFCGGTPRITRYEWAKSLSEQCAKYDVRFNLLWVGHNFVMPNGEVLKDYTKCYRSELADSLQLTHFKPIEFNLTTHKQIY